MNFKEAVRAYMTIARNHRSAPNAKPSPSRSNQARGTWYLRDRRGDQIARVSTAGVRFAGSNSFARAKQGVRRKRRA